jgi:segregation and condensation protein B
VAEDRGEVSPRGILEAMLFVGSPDNQPLTGEEVARLIRGVEPDEVDRLVTEMNAQYAELGCPYEIASEGLGYRLVLKPAFHVVRDKFYGRLRETRLSQAAVEVLAVVAYHEPLTVQQVNELRGSASGAVLSQLVRRQLLRLDRGDKTQPPRYSTTRRFLDLFGLESLGDLPRSQDVDQW